MKRLTIGIAALLLALQGAIIAGIPVAPASPQDSAAAREALLATFASPEALRKATFTVDGLAIGPRLWAASASARKAYAAETKDTYAIIPGPEIITQWKLTPVDLATIADPTLRGLLAEGAKGGTPVLAGAIMKRGDVVLPALLLGQLKPSDFPFTVRAPTEAELQYYYAMIPYELSDPILVVEGGSHAFLCDFENGVKVFYVEML